MICVQARRLFGACWDDEITQAERESLEFVESSIDCVGSIFYNFVDFNELGAGISARSIRLTFHTQAGPQNHVRIWEGLMVIKNQHRVVHAWRAVK